MSWLGWAAWAAVPVAFVVELSLARRAVERNERLAEAWLAAGARPPEVLARVRGRLRPAILIALLLVAAALARPAEAPRAAVLWSLGGIGVASVLASLLGTLRSFVDFRLVDRVPPEAGAPFRLRPYEPPATLEVYESRPPQDGSP